MSSILIRLPEGCALPTGLVLPEDVPIVATLFTDDLTDKMLQMFPTRLDLDCVTQPDQGPTMPRLFITPAGADGWTRRN
jgi:hypothetical protein